MLLQHIVNGLTLGGIYALVAVGFTMVYGVLKLLNFAHKQVLTWGAYLALTFVLWGVPFWLAALLSMICAMAMGMAIDYVGYRPLRDAPRLSALITAIGINMVLQEVAREVWGAMPLTFPRALVPAWFFEMVITEPVRVIGLQIFIWGVVIVSVIALWYIVTHTKMGKAMRAVSHDMPTAALMGININHVVSFTFALGSFLGGAAGILLGLMFSITPAMGFTPGIKAFAACVLGGIGNPWGAVLGGLVIGAAESLGAAYLHAGYRDAIAYAVMILIIVFRPAGLLGRHER